LSRFFINYGTYSKSEFLNIVDLSLKTKAHKIIESFVIDIDKEKTLFNIQESSINIKLYKKTILINTLISLGIMKRSTILNSKLEHFTYNHENNYIINLKEFFNVGLDYYKKIINNEVNIYLLKDLDDILKIKLYCKILSLKFN